MSDFDTLRIKLGRKPITVVELDLDFCQNTYGTSPCTANGTSKCFNTFKTCQDKGNYNKGTKTYKFCSDTSFAPVGEQVYPCITDVSLAPTKIDNRGISLRANISVSCKDFPYHDRGLDPYWGDRDGYSGTFFGKLKSRNPYIVNRVMRIKTGYVDDDRIIYSETHTYFLESIDGPDSNGRVKINAKDYLKLADDESTKAPAKNTGILAADIDENATQIPIRPQNVVAEYADSGIVRIGDEVIEYTSKYAGGLEGLTRGARGTTAASHQLKDTVQECVEYVNQTIPYIIKDLLVNYANIDESYIPYSDWVAEYEKWQGMFEFSAFLSEPKGVISLVDEILQSSYSMLWWDEVALKIKWKVLQVPEPDNLPLELTDDNNILQGSVKVKDLEKERLTRVSMYHNLYNVTDEPKKENFRILTLIINSDEESDNAFGEVKEREILSRWVEDIPIAKDIVEHVQRRWENFPIEVTFRVDAREDVKTGDLVDVYSRTNLDEFGDTGGVRLLVTEKREVEEGSHFECRGVRAGNVGEVFCWLADAEPDWDSASAEEKSTYMYLSDENGEIDGEPTNRLLY